MTTIAQIDKYAAKWIHGQMRRRGFAVEKKFVFWRKRGPLYDMFMSHLLAGDLLRVSVTIWSPWADSPTGELGEFPPLYRLIGGDLSEEFPNVMNSGKLFSVANEEEADLAFSEILNLIDEAALPWFSTIDCYESYASYIGDRGYYPTAEYEEKLKEGIKRGFQLERYV